MKNAAIAAVLASLAACGGSSSSPGMIGACPAVVNGCAAAAYVDLTADPTAIIEFGGTHGLTYVPACATVHVNQTIEFLGDFTTHPLSETCGPIDAIPATTGGTSRSFTIATAGAYGYQCDRHFGAGMVGALKVVP
jgi:plastocyanin